MATLAEAAAKAKARRGGWLIVALAALPALAGAGLLAAQALRPTTGTRAHAFSPDPAPPAVYAREICSLSNGDARAALVQGADGGESFVVGDRIWWLFGDTLFLADSGKQIEQNSIAWSDTLDSDGCPKLNYYARDGIAVPFLPKDGSLTVWPSGGWAVDDHTLDFYTVYVYGSGPYDYTLGEVGLARLDTTTMDVRVLARALWSDDHRPAGHDGQIIGAAHIELAEDGLLRVVLETRGAGVGEILARVAPDRMADALAYEYWDGAAWSASIDSARPLWEAPAPSDPVAKLASFENGASIAWNASLRKYVAVMNTGFSSVGARTADRLEGPWSAPQPWLDCLTFARTRVPTCYSPQQHGELAADDGGSLFLTVSSIEPYATAAFEVRPGVPFREWRAASDVVYAAASPGADWSDQGIAFYASKEPLPGFTPVYRWQSGTGARYAASSPNEGFAQGEAAFYAAAGQSVDGSSLTYRPVFDWHKDASHVLSTKSSGLEQYGYTRGAAAFYAP